MDLKFKYDEMHEKETKLQVHLKILRETMAGYRSKVSHMMDDQAQLTVKVKMYQEDWTPRPDTNPLIEALGGGSASEMGKLSTKEKVLLIDKLLPKGFRARSDSKMIARKSLLINAGKNPIPSVFASRRDSSVKR